MDVREHTSTGNGRLDERVELLVSANGQLQMARGDTLDLEVLGGVSSQLEDFGRQVLQNGGRVHGGGGSDTSVGRGAALEHAVDTTDRELQAGLARAGNGGLSLGLQARRASEREKKKEKGCCENAEVTSTLSSVSRPHPDTRRADWRPTMTAKKSARKSVFLCYFTIKSALVTANRP